MDHIAQRTDSDYYTSSQSNIKQHGNNFTLQNQSNNSNSGYRSSIANVTSGRNSIIPNTEGWKKSSKERITPTIETWKMSGKPRHAQLHHVQENRRQSAPIFNSPYHHPKPLPQEPSPAIHSEPYYPIPVMDEHHTQAPFHINTPLQPHQSAYKHSDTYSYPPSSSFIPPHQSAYKQNDLYSYPPSSEFIPPPLDYHSYQQQSYNEYPIQPPPPPHNEYLMHAYSQQYPNQDNPQQQPYKEYPILDYPPKQTLNTSSPKITASNTHQSKPQDVLKKDAKPEKKIPQITVQSVNEEHRVWIDILPTETGLSLAEKIHIIATFRTKKIVSIMSKAGRQVPLDNRPVFGSWMDMESFQDGETWTVEWKENDRGVVDRFMAKIVQSKRRD